MIPAFPKPGQVKKKPEVEHVYPDGRTKLNLGLKAGMDLYIQRKRVAWEEQNKTCSICHLKLNWADATVDHKDPRGMGGGFHDDRQPNIGAAHILCNSRKGSKRNYIEEMVP